MSDHIEQTIQHYEQKLVEQEAAVRRTKTLINALLADIGQQARYADTDDVAPVAGIALSGDEFAGAKTQHIGARMVLERRKPLNLTPCTVDEIYDDLVRGGFEFETEIEANRKRGLSQVLSKGSSVFRKLTNGKYGLWDWYGGPPKKKGNNKGGDTDNTDSDNIIVEDDVPESDDGTMPKFAPGAR